MKRISLSGWFYRNARQPLLIVALLFSIIEIAFFFYQVKFEQVRQNSALQRLNASLGLGVVQQNRPLIDLALGSAVNELSAVQISLCQNGNPIISHPPELKTCDHSIGSWFVVTRTMPVVGSKDYVIFSRVPLLPNYKIVVVTFVLTFSASICGLMVLARAVKRLRIDIFDALKVDPTSLTDASENLQRICIEEIRDLFLNHIRLIKDLHVAAVERAKQDQLARTAQMIAHDMRGPLKALERLKNASSWDDFRQKHDAANLALGRIGTLMEAFRTSDTDLIVRRSWQALGMSTVIREASDYAREKAVMLCDKLAHEERMYIDRTKMERVLLNLLNNAIESGSTIVTISNEGTDTEHLVFKVIDNGPGIPPSHLERLFTRGATFDKPMGTGLGLAYVKDVVEGHDGQVSYHRNDGLTTFTIMMPFASGYKRNHSSRSNQSLMANKSHCETTKPCAFINFKDQQFQASLCAEISVHHYLRVVTEICDFECANVVCTDDENLVLRAAELRYPVLDLDRDQRIEKIVRKIVLVATRHSRTDRERRNDLN